MFEVQVKEEYKKSTVSDTRRIRKPLMEKKRRARINDSLETLKQILLESKSTLKEGSRKNGQRTAKLEKADILEMTVRYLQHLHDKLNRKGALATKTEDAKEKEEIVIRPADSSCDGVKMGITLIPTKLSSGEIVFIIPPGMTDKTERDGRKKYPQKNSEVVWRPW